MRAATCSTRSGSGRLKKPRKASASSAARSPLKPMAPARMRPSSSGSTTCMARSAGARPRWPFVQASRRVVATNAWKTGTPMRSNSVSLPGSAPLAKAVAVTIAAGDKACRRPFDEGDDCRVLQARNEDRHGCHALARQRMRQRIDRRDVGREQHRAVEQDRDDGGSLTLPLEGRLAAQRPGGVVAARLATDSRYGAALPRRPPLALRAISPSRGRG